MNNEQTMSFRAHQGVNMRDRKLKIRTSGELPSEELDNKLNKFVNEFEEKEEKLLRKIHLIKVFFFSK